MKRNEYRRPRRCAARRVLKLSRAMTTRSGGRSPCWRAKSGSGGPAIPMAMPPGFKTRSDFASVSAGFEARGHQNPQRLRERVCALGVQHDVVVVHDRLEVLLPVVDDDVGADTLAKSLR